MEIDRRRRRRRPRRARPPPSAPRRCSRDRRCRCGCRPISSRRRRSRAAARAPPTTAWPSTPLAPMTRMRRRCDMVGLGSGSEQNPAMRRTEGFISGSRRPRQRQRSPPVASPQGGSIVGSPPSAEGSHGTGSTTSSRASAQAPTGARTSSSPTPRTPTWARACTRSGPAREGSGSAARLRTREEFLDSIEAILRQDVVDIMLTSVSNLERLAKRNAFAGTDVKPAIRANDTTDIWRHRGATHHHRAVAAVPHRLARPCAAADRPRPLFDHLHQRHRRRHRLARGVPRLPRRRRARMASPTSSKCSIRTSSAASTTRTMPQFVNDAIVRCLAGLTEAERPRFLKIAYNGPRALEELASYDPGLVVGVLGGGAGTTRDCFELIHQAQKVRRARRAVRAQDQSRRVAARHRAPDAGRRRRRADAARGGRGLSRGAAKEGRQADPRISPRTARSPKPC